VRIQKARTKRILLCFTRAKNFTRQTFPKNFFLENRVDISFIFLMIPAHITKTPLKDTKITIEVAASGGTKGGLVGATAPPITLKKL
jgi:hypothetical protein